MNLYSQVPIEKPGFDIQYQDGIFCLGSCFVAEIGDRLKQAKFQTLINPFGTQFHPLAMENVLSRVYTRSYYTEKEIYNYQGLFFSWDHSHLFSRPKLKQVLDLVNESIEDANDFLTRTSVFVFTLGTAWAYFLNGGFSVSNCHKVPQKNFNKLLLSEKEVFDALRNMVLMVKDVKPNAKIIFTVSPVRHVRDGYRENHVSKGVLHRALHVLLREYQDVKYFPSYEIVLDELRDYRFYDKDLVHLNELGVDYIWDKFKSTYFSGETQGMMQEVDKMLMALAHKPINPEGVEHRKFLFDTMKKLERLAMQMPKNSLNEEINELKSRIHVY